MKHALPVLFAAAEYPAAHRQGWRPRDRTACRIRSERRYGSRLPYCFSFAALLLIAYVFSISSCAPFQFSPSGSSGSSDTQECRHIGTTSFDGFGSEHNLSPKFEGSAFVESLGYYIETGSVDMNYERWLSLHTEELDDDDYNNAAAYLEDSSGEIQFFFYDDAEIDIEISALLDPFEDNAGEGEVLLYAVFEGGAPIETDGERHLYIDREGYLTYEIEVTDDEDDEELYQTRNFVIRNQSMQSGDDFVLNFTSGEGWDEVYSFDPDDPEYEEEINDCIDFFGIVDYRFLDEANLYIDDGDDDWNGIKQDPISPFTWFSHDMDDNTNTSIYNSVAYSTGAQDNPEEFNDKMEQQRICIEEFSRYAEYYNESLENDDDKIIVCPDDPDLYFTEWDTTLAPLEMWTYYVRAKDAINAGFCADESLIEFNSYNPNELFDDYEGDEDYPLKDIRPYSPGYSSMKEVYGYEDQYYYRGQSAGTDCIGFVQRSAGYPDNPYRLPELGDDTGGGHPWTWNNDWSGDGAAGPYVANRQYLYYEGDNGGASYTVVLDYVTNYSDEKLEKILPGDILYYWTEGYHVGIVDRVDYALCNFRSDISLEQIHIIEATHANDPIIGNVTNIRDLEQYGSFPFNKLWRIGRLKQE